MFTDHDIPVEHDELWKEIIEEFILHFIRYFYPDDYHQFDLTAEIVFLENELNALLRDASGGNRRADKLVRITMKDGRYQWLYIHIEVQGYDDPEFNLRMFNMHYRLFEKYGPNITSLALLTDHSSTFRPGKYQHGSFGTQLTFTYPTVKLKDIDEAAFIDNSNPIAIILYTAWLHLKSGKANNEQILHNKITLLRQLSKLSLTNKERTSVLNFIKYYTKFKKFENSAYNLKFEEGVKVELNLPRDMGMTEMLQRKFIQYGEARGLEKGEERGIKKGEERGIKKGEARGIKKGEARGIEKEKLAMARKSIAKGLDDVLIAELTGLSLPQIAAIKNEMQ